MNEKSYLKLYIFIGRYYYIIAVRCSTMLFDGASEAMED